MIDSRFGRNTPALVTLQLAQWVSNNFSSRCATRGVPFVACYEDKDGKDGANPGGGKNNDGSRTQDHMTVGAPKKIASKSFKIGKVWHL